MSSENVTWLTLRLTYESGSYDQIVFAYYAKRSQRLFPHAGDKV